MSRILIVEDDEIFLKALRSVISKQNHEVTIAKNGKEALESINNNEFDLVITDLMMVYANGLELISRIKNDPSKNNTGIIVISSISNEDTIAECYALGCDEFLRKPLMARELVIRIDKLLKNKRNDKPNLSL